MSKSMLAAPLEKWSGASEVFVGSIEDDSFPAWETDEDTEVVPLSGSDFPSIEFVPATSRRPPPKLPRATTVPRPAVGRPASLPSPAVRPSAPATLRMEDIPTRRGSNERGDVRVSQLSFDEDTFSGRTTATYRKLELSPAERADASLFDVPPSAFHDDAAIAPQPYVVGPSGPPPALAGAHRRASRWLGPSLAGALLGGLIAVGAYGAPRLMAKLSTPAAGAPLAAIEGSREHASETARAITEATTKDDPAKPSPGVTAASPDLAARPEATLEANDAPTPPAAAAPSATPNPTCAGSSTLSPELCTFIDGVAAGETVARPRLAAFQRFLLERGITRIRGRVLKPRDDGSFAFTLSGSFGYCLHASHAPEVGSLYLGWAERLPPTDRCANLRAVKFPAMIEALLAATPDTQRALAQELQVVVARELPRSTTR